MTKKSQRNKLDREKKIATISFMTQIRPISDLTDHLDEVER